jgi:hypothetical protein
MARQKLSSEAIQQIRSARDVTPYTIYDTIVVGKDAQKRDPGWYNTFQEFAGSNSLNLFAGRQGNVGNAYTNMRDPRRDWAMDLKMAHIELYVTAPAIADYLSQPYDAQLLPTLWCEKLPQQTTFNLGLGDASDNMLNLPLTHVPAGYGASGGVMDGSAGPAMSSAVNGSPHVSNFFAWPSDAKLELAAKSKIDLSLSISDPIRSLMTNADFPAPGEMVLNVNGREIRSPINYCIRFSFVGMRALQMRGARSA